MSDYIRKKIRLVVGLSGAGRSLTNLLEEQDNHHYKIVGVFSSSIKAKGIDIARSHQIPTISIDFNTFESANSLDLWLKSVDAEMVALAGFTKYFPTLPDWKKRVLNIHPALLPNYGGKGMYGMKVHKAVAKAKEQESGATVHYVTEEYDSGPIIGQAFVDISDCRKAKDIADRVFDAECMLYPKAIDFAYARLLDPGVETPPLIMKAW